MGKMKVLIIEITMYFQAIKNILKLAKEKVDHKYPKVLRVNMVLVVNLN